MSRPPPVSGRQVRHSKSLAYDLRDPGALRRSTASHSSGNRREALLSIREPVPPGVYDAGNAAIRARRSRAGLLPSERELREELIRPRMSSSAMSSLSMASSQLSQSALSQYSQPSQTSPSVYSQSSASTQHVEPLRPHSKSSARRAECISIAASDRVFEEIRSLILVYSDLRTSLISEPRKRMSSSDLKEAAKQFATSLDNYLRVIRALPEPHSEKAQELMKRISDYCGLLADTACEDSSAMSNIIRLALENCAELMEDAFRFVCDAKPLPPLPPTGSKKIGFSTEWMSLPSVDFVKLGRSPSHLRPRADSSTNRDSPRPSNRLVLEGVGSLERVTDIYDPLFDKPRGVAGWVAGKVQSGKQATSSDESIPDVKHSPTSSNSSAVDQSTNDLDNAEDNAAHIKASLRDTHALIENLAPEIEQQRRTDTRCINYTPDGTKIKAISEEQLALLICYPSADPVERQIVLRLRHWWWDAEGFCSELWRIFSGELTDPTMPLEDPRQSVMAILELWISVFMNPSTVVADKPSLTDLLRRIAESTTGATQLKARELLSTVRRMKSKQKCESEPAVSLSLHFDEDDDVVRSEVPEADQEEAKRLRDQSRSSKESSYSSDADTSQGDSSSIRSSSSCQTSVESSVSGTQEVSTDSDAAKDDPVKKKIEPPVRMARKPNTMKLGDNDMIRDLAQQLTLYENSLVCAMDPEHVARFKFLKDDVVCGLAKRILKAQQVFLDRLEGWVHYEFYTQTSPAERARVFTAFVQLASRLYGLRNFSAAQVVTNACASYRITYREFGQFHVAMRLTYKFIDDDVIDRLEDLDNFFKSFSKYWSRIKEDTRPLVPHLSSILGKYIRISELKSKEVKSSVDNNTLLVNFERYRSCYEIILDMESVQRRYDIPWNERVQKDIKRTFERMDTSRPDLRPIRKTFIAEEDNPNIATWIKSSYRCKGDHKRSNSNTSNESAR
ncbi:ras GEF [Schizopora paradoxa]|uniref:Ras GEF n=1 Tax=Schizopora paradoxa TaxID=27342 RepID=A0A0H2SFZ8_9AGAM|nr:ras GEF [Schizopora paradoxa]